MIRTSIALSLVLASPQAKAEERPTSGGIWGFDPSDSVSVWDEPSGRIRVHYSESGPNATLHTDEDADHIPDYPQLVARVTAEALDTYQNLGFRPPKPEFDTGESLGGSEALDIYLIDFGGASDGRFGLDSCAPDTDHCSGFLVIENDFVGYAYPSLTEAVRIVASHELFHAVQAAYTTLPAWISEGTATWATHRFDDSLFEFVRACRGYLADPGRPIYQPPLGPVPAFAYGSALWWEFMSTQTQQNTIAALFAALDVDAGLRPPHEVMEEVLAQSNASLLELWPRFARYNLAAGFRATIAESHVYASELEPIEADAEGQSLDLNARIYPLATEYWRLDHPGGSLLFGTDAPMPDAQFSLHPIANFASDGVVGDAIAQWDADQNGWFSIIEPGPPAGGYWIVATLPVIASTPVKARVCIGSVEHLMHCRIEARPDPTPSDPTMGSTTDEFEGLTDSTPLETESTLASNDLDASGCACRYHDFAPTPMLGLIVMTVMFRPRRRHGSQ